MGSFEPNPADGEVLGEGFVRRMVGCRSEFIVRVNEQAGEIAERVGRRLAFTEAERLEADSEFRVAPGELRRVGGRLTIASEPSIRFDPALGFVPVEQAA
jgi:hypothetical protein